MKTRDSGFTLIELMIVVAIVGILAAIAIPAYQGYIGRTQITEALTVIDEVRTGVANFHMQQGRCPVQGAGGDPGFGPPANYSGKYITQVSIADGGASAHPVTGSPALCSMTATFRAAGVHADLAGQTFVVDYAPAGGGSVAAGFFNCQQTATGGTVQATPELLPFDCR